MTIRDLRLAIRDLPDDMLVLVTGYEMGLIGPESVHVCSVVQKTEYWIDMYAPMLGSHAFTSDRETEDSAPFDAFCIERP